MNKVYIYHLVVWGIRTNKHNNKESLYFNRCSMSYKSDQISLYKNYNIQKNHIYKNDQKNESTNHTIQRLASQSIISEYYESRQYNIQLKYKRKR